MICSNGRCSTLLDEVWPVAFLDYVSLLPSMSSASFSVFFSPFSWHRLPFVRFPIVNSSRPLKKKNAICKSITRLIRPLRAFEIRTVAFFFFFAGEPVHRIYCPSTKSRHRRDVSMRFVKPLRPLHTSGPHLPTIEDYIFTFLKFA